MHVRRKKNVTKFTNVRHAYIRRRIHRTDTDTHMKMIEHIIYNSLTLLKTEHIETHHTSMNFHGKKLPFQQAAEN